MPLGITRATNTSQPPVLVRVVDPSVIWPLNSPTTIADPSASAATALAPAFWPTAPVVPGMAQATLPVGVSFVTKASQPVDPPPPVSVVDPKLAAPTNLPTITDDPSGSVATPVASSAPAPPTRVAHWNAPRSVTPVANASVPDAPARVSVVAPNAAVGLPTLPTTTDDPFGPLATAVLQSAPVPERVVAQGTPTPVGREAAKAGVAVTAAPLPAMSPAAMTVRTRMGILLGRGDEGCFEEHAITSCPCACPGLPDDDHVLRQRPVRPERGDLLDVAAAAGA